MKKYLFIILLFLVSIGFSQQEYDHNDLIEIDSGLWTEKFSDVLSITGKVFGYFGEIEPYKKVYMGHVKNGKEDLPILIKPGLFIIEFYQNYLGKIKGSYCPMYPSCSEYGKIAIIKNGYVGILQTFDRLHRCSHDLENYKIIIFNNEIKYFDKPD